MEPKASRAVVGLFVLLLGVGLVASILWLVGFGRGATETYLVLMKESVSGLSQDAPVKYRGVDVGHVEHIGILPDDPETIVLTLQIDPATPIREDTRAQIEFQGLTGLAAINLLGGSRQAAPLRRKPGQRYPVIESAPSLMSRLESNVMGLMETLNKTSQQLSGVLAAVDRESLARTIENLERVSTALASRSGDIEKGTADASRFFANAADASEDLPELVAKLETLTEEWSRASASVQELASEGRTDLARASTQLTGETRALGREVRSLVARLDRVVGELESDPSVLLHGRGSAKPGPGE